MLGRCWIGGVLQKLSEGEFCRGSQVQRGASGLQAKSVNLCLLTRLALLICGAKHSIIPNKYFLEKGERNMKEC